MFARYGIPENVVSDNGPQLASEKFSQFFRQNGVKFTRRVPTYHPSSNGTAERSVQTAKVVLTEQMLDGKENTLSLEDRLANFLNLNRSTPYTVTGQSPAELGREIRNYMKEDHRSYIRNFCSCEKKAWLVRDSNP